MGSINWDASVQSVMQLAIQFPAESYSGELVDIYDFAGAGTALQALENSGAAAS